TVANIPIWSAATRSISRAAAATPRKKFPPPTTNPICTCARATSAISHESALTRSASIPKDPSPASTSPEIFSKMRLYFAKRSPLRLFGGGSFGRLHVAHFEAHESGNRDILAQFRDLRFDHVG